MYVQQPTDKLVIFGSVSATSCTYSNQQTNLSSLARCQLRHVRTATNRQTCHLWLSVSYALYVQQPTDKLVIFGSVSASPCTYSNQQTNLSSLAQCQLRHVRTATNRQTCYALYVQQPTDKLVIFGSVSASPGCRFLLRGRCRSDSPGGSDSPTTVSGPLSMEMCRKRTLQDDHHETLCTCHVWVCYDLFSVSHYCAGRPWTCRTASVVWYVCGKTKAWWSDAVISTGMSCCLPVKNCILCRYHLQVKLVQTTKTYPIIHLMSRWTLHSTSCTNCLPFLKECFAQIIVFLFVLFLVLLCH